MEINTHCATCGQPWLIGGYGTNVSITLHAQNGQTVASHRVCRIGKR